MPDVAIAHKLSEEGEIRWLAEARLLGEESVAVVARHAGVEPAAAGDVLTDHLLAQLEARLVQRLEEKISKQSRESLS